VALHNSRIILNRMTSVFLCISDSPYQEWHTNTGVQNRFEANVTTRTNFNVPSEEGYLRVQGILLSSNNKLVSLLYVTEDSPDVTVICSAGRGAVEFPNDFDLTDSSEDSTATHSATPQATSTCKTINNNSDHVERFSFLFYSCVVSSCF